MWKYIAVKTGIRNRWNYIEELRQCVRPRRSGFLGGSNATAESILIYFYVRFRCETKRIGPSDACAPLAANLLNL